jgi:DNA-directed RNA polymerase sigma subunit (sigma70/sigma32)
VAEALDCSEAEVEQLIDDARMMHSIASLDAPLKEEEDTTLQDVTATDTPSDFSHALSPFRAGL